MKKIAGIFLKRIMKNALLRESSIYDYSEKGVGESILENTDSNVVLACISGVCPLSVSNDELNEFCNHMASAAIFGDPVGQAFSCFAEQGGSFKLFLPIPINKVKAQALAMLAEIIENPPSFGLSKSGGKYFEENFPLIEKMAKRGNPDAEAIYDCISG